MSNKLPTGWIETTLSDVFTFSGGGTPDKKNPLFWGGNIPWVSVKDVKEKYTYRSIDSITQEGVDNSATQIAKEDSVVLITRISPGKTTILKIPAAINQDLKIVNRPQRITSEFVYYLFLFLEKQIVNRSSGTTVLGINLNQLGSLTFSLPPLNEQNRIVAKIEELFSELDAGVENLTKAKEQLGVYRQSLLKHAFEGKLTEEWRKENTNKLESGEALLKRVKKEREKYFKKQLEQWEKDVTQWEADGKPGKKPTKSKKPKKLAPISDEELQELPELPEGWVWCKLNELAVLSQNGFGKRHATSGKPRIVLRLADITNSKISLDSTRTIPCSTNEIDAYKLVEDDILWIRVNGSPQLVGQVIHVGNYNYDILYCDHFIRMRFAYPFISKWIKTISSAKTFRSSLAKGIKTTAGQHTISQGSIVELAVPMPPEKEANELANRIENDFSILEKTEAEIQNKLEQSQLLRRSILKKAFSGNLVPQDPDDEPASMLLERIKQERKNAPKPKRTRKPKTKTKRITMADLKEVLAAAKDWISAQDAFRQCGVGDGAPTDDVEKLYDELKQQLDLKVIEVERRGDEDWLRLAAEG